MNTKLNMILRLVAHYKYLITTVVGVALVGFLDENSLLMHVRYRLRISELNDQIEMYDSCDCIRRLSRRLPVSATS